MRRFAYVISALAVVVVALTVSRPASSAPTKDATITGSGLADVSVTPLQAGPGMISEAEAISAAGKVQSIPGSASMNASLVIMTDPNTLRGDTPIKNRAVWLVHLSGIAYPVSVPFGAKLPENPTLSNGYVYIDAYTGDWLLSRFED